MTASDATSGVLWVWYHVPLRSPQDTIEKLYRERLARELRSVNVLRHLAEHADGGGFGTLDLADLFVPPRIHSDEEHRQAQERLLELRATLALPSLGAAEREALNKEIRHHERYPWTMARPFAATLGHLLPAQRPHALVLGDPGSGKTTLLRAFGLAVTGHAPGLLDSLYGLANDAQIPDIFPVYASLGAFAESEQPSLLAYLRTSTEYLVPGAAAVLDTHLAAGTALILLDGLDEIPRSARRTWVARQVEAFFVGHPSTRGLISSRPAGHLAIAGTHEFHVAPLDREQTRQLLTNLLQARARRLGTDPAAISGSVEQTLEPLGREQFRDLTQNPLLITIIAACNVARVELPRDRVVLYHRIIKTLLETWEEARHLTAPDESVDPADLWPVLAGIALKAQLAHGSAPRPREAWEHDLASALHERGHDAARSASIARTYLDVATRRAGLLAVRGSGKLAFWHPTFGEYLAGVALAHEPQQLQKLRNDPRTVEIAAFALDHISRLLGRPGPAAELLSSLADDSLRPWESVLSPVLRFATACLARTHLPSVELWDDLLARLIDRTLALPYPPHLTALEELSAAARDRPPGPQAITALLGLLARSDFAHHAIRTHAIARLARHAVTDPRVRSLCEATLSADNYFHGEARDDPRVHAALGLLRAGIVRADLCRAVTHVPLFGRQNRGIPFAPTEHGCEVRELVRPLLTPLRTLLRDCREPAVALVLALINERSHEALEVLEQQISSDGSSLPAVAEALAWLALGNGDLRERMFGQALADARRRIRHDTREHYPWIGLAGLYRGATRDEMVCRLVDELLRTPTAVRDDVWSLTVTLFRRTERSFYQELLEHLGRRIDEADDAALLALQALQLDGFQFAAQRGARACIPLSARCLADTRPWLRAAALEQFASRIDDAKIPKPLEEVVVAALVANLAAEDAPAPEIAPTPNSVLDWPHHRLPAQIREQAVEMLQGGLSTASVEYAAQIVTALHQSLAALSTNQRAWAAIVLARAGDTDPRVLELLSAALDEHATAVSAAAGQTLLAVPRALSDDLRQRALTAAWLEKAKSFHSSEPFAFPEPPSDATIERILDCRLHLVARPALTWLFSNPRAVALLCRRLTDPAHKDDLTARMLLQDRGQDPRITEEMIEILDATPPDRAIDLAYALHRRIHGDLSSATLDPRVVQAYERCLDTPLAEHLAFALEELVWNGTTHARVQAALRRGLRANDPEIRWRIAETCIRYSGRALPKPVDPTALRQALQDNLGFTGDELLDILDACVTDDGDRGVDIAALQIALGATQVRVHTVLDPVLASPGPRQREPSLCKWALPEPVLRALCDVDGLRSDHIAATLLQQLDGTPLSPHLRTEALARLREPIIQHGRDRGTSWALRILLRDRSAAPEALAVLEAVLRKPLSQDLQVAPSAEDSLQQREANRLLGAATALIAAADVPEAAFLWVRFAVFDLHTDAWSLHWEHVPHAVRELTTREHVLAALHGHLDAPDPVGFFAARLLCVLGDAPPQARERVLDAWFAGRAQRFHDKDALAERAAIWPHLRSRWSAGALTAEQFARAMEFASADDIPADELTPLVEPLLASPRWRVRCGAVALCHARALPVNRDAFLAALRICTAEGPYLFDALIQAIRAHLEVLEPELLHRLEHVDLRDSIWHAFREHPAVQRARRERLLRQLDPHTTEERVHDLRSELQFTGATDDELRVHLLPHLLAGQAQFGWCIRVPFDPSRLPRMNAWNEPLNTEPAPLRHGLTLAAHPEWANATCRGLLATALESTPEALDALLAAIRRTPGAPELIAQARDLAEFRPEDDFRRRLARAWWFGQLPHDDLAAYTLPRSAPTQSGLARRLPLVVLMVSASPDTSVRLRVDKEFAKIIEQIRKTRYRDRIRFEQVQAATFDDLSTALMEHKPHVLHISSHGTGNGSLLFEGEGQASTVVSKSNVLRLLSRLKDRLRLVVLNACHSHAIARDIPPTIDLAIGMNREVSDSSAIRFAVAFYETLGYGKSVDTAFDVALVRLNGADEDVPELFPPPSLDPSNKRGALLLGEVELQ